MKVQCYLCEHEEDGFCSRKRRNGKPTRIKPKKRRICALYDEEAVRVLTDFRRKEAHTATLRNQEKRRALLAQALREAKKKGIDRLMGREE